MSLMSPQALGSIIKIFNIRNIKMQPQKSRWLVADESLTPFWVLMSNYAEHAYITYFTDLTSPMPIGIH